MEANKAVQQATILSTTSAASAYSAPLTQHAERLRSTDSAAYVCTTDAHDNPIFPQSRAHILLESAKSVQRDAVFCKNHRNPCSSMSYTGFDRIDEIWGAAWRAQILQESLKHVQLGVHRFRKNCRKLCSAMSCPDFAKMVEVCVALVEHRSCKNRRKVVQRHVAQRL